MAALLLRVVFVVGGGGGVGERGSGGMDDCASHVFDVGDEEPIVCFVGVVSSDVEGAPDEAPEVVGGVCEAFGDGADDVAGFDDGDVMAAASGWRGCEFLDEELGDEF